MNFLKLKSSVFYLLAILSLIFLSTETSLAQLTTTNGSLYFKNTGQRFVGNGVSDLRYFSDSDQFSYLSFYNNKNKQLGRVYGGIASDGNPVFGLLDADSNWSLAISNDKYINFNIDNEVKMSLAKNGQLDLNATRDASGTPGTGVLEIGNSLRFDNNEIVTNTNEALLINVDNNGDVVIDGKTFRVDANEDCVRIGDVLPTGKKYKLYVEKGILTEKVRIAVNKSIDWADYVFEEDYDLMPLKELKDYVTENKHLPNVPSAKEVTKEGIDMAQMDATLLEKIEEAHLYIIKQQKEIEDLKAAINSMK